MSKAIFVSENDLWSGATWAYSAIVLFARDDLRATRPEFAESLDEHLDRPMLHLDERPRADVSAMLSAMRHMREQIEDGSFKITDEGMELAPGLIPVVVEIIGLLEENLGSD